MINPAGILFGPDARLNVLGDFTATTATGIGLSSGGLFQVGDNPDYSRLVGYPNQFVFSTFPASEFSSEPLNQEAAEQAAEQVARPPRWGSLVNLGVLQVQPGQQLNLVGGTVVNAGDLVAPGGQVRLVAVPQGESLHQEGMILHLEVALDQVADQLDPRAREAGENAPGTFPFLNPLSLPQLLTFGNFDHANQLRVTEDGTALLTGSGLRIGPETGMTVVTGTIAAPAGTIDVLG